MPEFTSYAHGTPCWVDVTSPELDQSIEFYKGLFGWEAEVAQQPEAGGYTMFKLKDKYVAAASPPQEERSASYWTTYLASDDVVKRLIGFARDRGCPDVVVARSSKNDVWFPKHAQDVEPAEGEVDLCSFIVRRDVFAAHVGDFGARYQGDYDWALALRRAGRLHERMEMLFACGRNSNGRPEY